jgi:hypothetical protein
VLRILPVVAVVQELLVLTLHPIRYLAQVELELIRIPLLQVRQEQALADIMLAAVAQEFIQQRQLPVQVGQVAVVLELLAQLLQQMELRILAVAVVELALVAILALAVQEL